MKSKQGTLLLAVILAAPVFAFADNIPGHSKGANKYVTFSEGFTSQQNSPRGSAECNLLFGVPKENGLSASSIVAFSSSSNAIGEKASALGSGGAAGGNSVNLVDFSGNSGSSSDNDNGKGKGKKKGKQSGDPSPLVVVSEPGSRSLLLFGLAGLGVLALRRKTFINAI